jgi:hypothetical protein
VRAVLLTRRAAAVAAAAGLGVLGISVPAIASSATNHPGARPALGGPDARPALPAGQQYACPPARPGWMTCMSIVRTARLWSPTRSAALVPAANGPYFPADLRSAYKLTSASPNRGIGKTVAIVDAFNDPNAGKDLGVYRHSLHLPGCTKANGCLHIVNQRGNKSPLPRANASWGVEISLDLDMVSAICPRCHITLVEADSPTTLNLGTAVNTAVNLGAKYVSNSWGGPEFTGENHYSHFFNHPGRVIDFASGDLGFGPTFPADLQYVTSIGGTRLVHSSSGRGWSESVWGTSATEGTGSGCSNGQAKPSWQTEDGGPGGCLTRTQNDVAAVADPNTGVAVYDTFGAPGGIIVGGTSASTPIITAIYALAGKPKTNTYPAEYAYLRKGQLFDVTTGSNGPCPSSRPYLCTGEMGYDGPTGLGTPDGIKGFGVGAATMVTVVDPGRQVGQHGHAFSVKIIGLDSRKVSSLRWSTMGLPRGLSIKALSHSTDATISGTIHGSAGTYHVTVTGKDGSATGTTHFRLVVH